MRRDEHNQQLLRADKHLSQIIQNSQPDHIHIVITEASTEKLIQDWKGNREKSLFNLATFGNFNIIQSLLPPTIDVDKAAAGRVQAIVRGACSRFHLMMGVGIAKHALRRLHTTAMHSDATLMALADHDDAPRMRRDIIKKMVAKVGVVLVVKEGDAEVDQKDHSTKHFPFLLSCRPNWMGKISHIEAYDVRCDRQVRIKLQHPFLPIREKGIPRRLVLSLECKRFVSADLVRENIRSVSNKCQGLRDTEDASDISAGTVTARTELLIKYTDTLTSEYMYRSMLLKFSFDHQKHNAEEILICEEDSRKNTPNLDFDDISQCTDFVVDVNDENLVKIRRELDTSSVVADVDSVARSSDLGSFHSKAGIKVDTLAIDKSQKSTGERTQPAASKSSNKYPTASGASVASSGLAETMSLAHVEEEVDYSSSVILTNIQQAVIYKGALLWKSVYYFVTLVNENDITFLKLTETRSLFSLVFVMHREHFDRSTDIAKLVRKLLQYAARNVLISSLFDNLEMGLILTPELLSNLNSSSPLGVVSTFGSKSHLVKYFDEQCAVVVGLFSARSSPIIGNRFEIFDSSGHYLDTRRSRRQSMHRTPPLARQLFAQRFLDAAVDHFIKHGEISEIDTLLDDEQKNAIAEDIPLSEPRVEGVSDLVPPSEQHLELHDDSHEAPHHRSIHKHHFVHRKMMDTGGLHHKLVSNTVALQIYHTKKEKKHRHDSMVKFSPRTAHSPRSRQSIDHGHSNEVEGTVVSSDMLVSEPIESSTSNCNVQLETHSDAKEVIKNTAQSLDEDMSGLRESQADGIVLINETSQSLDEDMSGLRPGGIMDEDSTSVVILTDTQFNTESVSSVHVTSVPDLQARISLDSSYICDPPLLPVHFEDGASVCSNEEPGSPLDGSTADLSVFPEIPMRYRLSAEDLQLISTLADQFSTVVVQVALEAATQRHHESVEIPVEEPSLPTETQFESPNHEEITNEKPEVKSVDNTEVQNVLEAIVLAVEYLTLSYNRQQKLNSSAISVEISMDDTVSLLPSQEQESSEVKEFTEKEPLPDDDNAPQGPAIEHILEVNPEPVINDFAVEFTNMIINEAKMSYQYRHFDVGLLEPSIVNLLPDSKDSYESLDDNGVEEGLSITSKENPGLKEVSPAIERYQHSPFPFHNRPDYYDLNGDIYHRSSVGMLSTITSNSAESKVSSSYHSEEYKFVDTRNKYLR